MTSLGRNVAWLVAAGSLVLAGCGTKTVAPTRQQLQAEATVKIDRAREMYDHGLREDAKRSLFEVRFDTKFPAESRADALYWLSSTAVGEGRYRTAFDDLETLAKEFPKTKRASGAKKMLSQLRQVVTKFSKDDVTSPVASAYLRNGDFWSHDAGTFTIDSSWLPEEDMAVEWYERVIKDFPGSSAAEEAYAREVNTLLGWEDQGAYGSTKYGARRDFSKYMPRAIDAFSALEKQFPNSRYLQALRYQIGQAYWRARKWAPARDWFGKAAAATPSDFYSEIAKRRLAKLKW